jgi:methanethiol S-methyltransferase
MFKEHFLLASLWVVYGMLHSILASLAIKERAARLLGRYFCLYRSFYNLISILLLVPMLALQLRMHSPLLFTPVRPLQFLAIVIAVAGMAGLTVSLAKYIASPSGFRDLFIEGVRPPLQVSGIHARVRHPLYLFTFLLIWGVFLYRPLLQFLIMNAVITIYTIIAIRFEEKKLIKVYGKEYEDYRSNVPMILPRLKS